MISGTTKTSTKSGPSGPVFITKIFQKIQEHMGASLNNEIWRSVNLRFWNFRKASAPNFRIVYFRFSIVWSYILSLIWFRNLSSTVHILKLGLIIFIEQKKMFESSLFIYYATKYDMKTVSYQANVTGISLVKWLINIHTN